MRLPTTPFAIAPLLSLAAFAEPVDLMGAPGLAGLPGTETVCGTVFYDLDGDAVHDPSEVGVEGLRLQVLKDNVMIAMGETGADGTYNIEFEKPKGPPRGLMVKILGPTGVLGVYGFIGDGVPGAHWLLTDDQEDTVPFSIKGGKPVVDFGVLAFGNGVGIMGFLLPNLPIQSEAFWCDVQNKQLALMILEGCDPEIRVLLNSLCLQHSCRTNQQEGDGGTLDLNLGNSVESTLNQLCNFFEKENCGPTMAHVLSEFVALVQLSAFCILDSSNNQIFFRRPDNVLIDLAEQTAITAQMMLAPFCEDPEADPMQDPAFVAAMQNCINEWDDAVDDGVFGRSEQPIEPEYGGN